MPLSSNSKLMKKVRAGEFPFLHGVYPGMYTKRHWTMRQYSGFATAEESNERYHYLLEHGVTGLSVAFDLPTQLGLDSDDARSKGEVGKAGVSISSLADMEALFNGIPLEKVSTSMTINATAAIILAAYLVVAEKQGVEWSDLSGTVQNDLLKEFAARGNYIYPAESSLRITTDIIEFCAKEVPKWNPISISGYHMREAGCTAAQEIGFTLANGITYVQAAVDRGLSVNDFGPRLSFFFNSHNNFLEEIAKFRAARRLWARIMRDKFGANDLACRLRFHTQTGGSTLTAQQIDNNVVRVAYQAMSAVLGGTQSLHTNAKDEALALPTEESVRTALRTQQVLANETGVTEWIDPLAGSYVIEELTDKLEVEAKEYIKKIGDMGGAVESISSGFVQGEIQNAAYDYQKAIEQHKQIVVGVNQFETEESISPEIFRVNDQLEKNQSEKLSKLRKTRNNNLTTKMLSELKIAAKGTENLMPHIIKCVREYATLGEISGTLRDVFGEYQENF